MDTDIVSIGDVVIDELLDITIHAADDEAGALVSEIGLEAGLNRRFGIVDLWKIRKSIRHFNFYR